MSKTRFRSFKGLFAVAREWGLCPAALFAREDTVTLFQALYRASVPATALLCALPGSLTVSEAGGYC